jgi:rhamnulokinase
VHLCECIYFCVKVFGVVSLVLLSGMTVALARLLMENFYAACDLKADLGRVLLGDVHKGKLTLSEVRRFDNGPVREKGGLQWDIPRLYQEVLEGLRVIGKDEVNLHSVSCDSWAADYLLFDEGGAIITPTYHREAPGAESNGEEATGIPWEEIYAETGLQNPANTRRQLAQEKPRRLRHASQLLPVADGFNYLLAGVPRAEMTLASSTQLFNPITRNWSERLVQAMRLPPRLLPELVPAGTRLGMLRPEIARDTRLEDTCVVASCSHEIAATLAGLPAGENEQWAYLQVGPWSVMGTEIPAPMINDASREMNFTNEFGYNGAVRFSKRVPGLWLLEECRRHWEATDRGLDDEMVSHLAAYASPFECLINPSDPRFLAPDEMPLKIQAYCRETQQFVPRKPGPIARCVLESLALHYRRTLCEIEQLTGRRITRLYLLGAPTSLLLRHFIANALQVPVVVAPADASAIGNIIVQALALGHITSLSEARRLVQNSFKTETIEPHATVWSGAYDRFIQLLS